MSTIWVSIKIIVLFRRMYSQIRLKFDYIKMLTGSSNIPPKSFLDECAMSDSNKDRLFNIDFRLVFNPSITLLLLMKDMPELLAILDYIDIEEMLGKHCAPLIQTKPKVLMKLVPKLFDHVQLSCVLHSTTFSSSLYPES